LNHSHSPLCVCVCVWGCVYVCAFGIFEIGLCKLFTWSGFIPAILLIFVIFASVHVLMLTLKYLNYMYEVQSTFMF
jgi:hypothetical protein